MLGSCCIYIPSPLPRKREKDERPTYLVGNLELLASTDVLRLGNSGLEAVEGLVVQLLKDTPLISIMSILHSHRPPKNT